VAFRIEEAARLRDAMRAVEQFCRPQQCQDFDKSPGITWLHCDGD
jgi:excinuclease UvrABC nuclease subunit